MFFQFNFCTFSLFILISLLPTNVENVTCTSYQNTCNRHGISWCCENYHYCGNYEYECVDISTTVQNTTTRRSIPDSSSFPSSLLTVLILAPLFCITICICLGIRSSQYQQSLRSSTNTTTRQVTTRRPMRVVLIRPVYSIYEAPPPPPSYEITMADLPPKYTSAPLTPMTEQTDSQV